MRPNCYNVYEMQRIQKVGQFIRNLMADRSYDTGNIEKFDETLSPNMRALRLSMTIADNLLSMGVSSSDVASMALDVTDTYCKSKVQFDISSTILMASQDRGNDREPLTLIRTLSPRTVNDRQIQAIQELTRDIFMGKYSLEKAEERMDYISTHPDKYPLIVTTTGSALISTGVGMLLGARPITLLIMFIIGAIVALGLRLLTRRKVPAFFAQIIAAMLITLAAAGITWAGYSMDLKWLQVVTPGFVVTGGIVMLVAGLAIVAAVQDAIDEFYVTANARLLKVAMMTIGIVIGVMIGIYFSRQLGVWIDPTPATPNDVDPIWRYMGAAVIAGGLTLSNHSKPSGVVIAGAIGVMSYTIFVIATSNSYSAIAASGVAAIAVGIASTLLSRVWRMPSNALVMAGIVPLVPGIMLYNGLLKLFIDTSAGADVSDAGTATLMTAGLIALSIACGASFGIFVTRPIRRTLIRARNTLPRYKLH